MGIHEAADDVLRRCASASFSEAADLYVALSLGRLYWPETRLVNGAVFLALNPGDAEEIERRVAAWNESGAMTWSQFVDSFNAFDIRYLFAQWPGYPEALEEAEMFLAQLLLEAWTAKLRSDFPDRAFSVELDDDIESDGPRILVRQTRIGQ
ncbi:hypothetical protein EJ357_00590 [Streptomyces cyaneochromogenes]|uniref:DUF4303 domain-containing protein n=1 Tax=Streptomyces cyaneochromogenes TaxID=2496836 RepID=A0A3S9LYZ2_9ACTN|nr:hypothetical protein [Streptomyces cyaneochromogenes]AZQ32158.1 hypothetical protein EJ357_00590 [Streptomyces cyaneochromogenes]